MLATVTMTSKAYPCFKTLSQNNPRKKKALALSSKDFFSESHVLNNPEVLH